MQWYSSIHSLPFHTVLVMIPSHFLNLPPKALHGPQMQIEKKQVSARPFYDSEAGSRRRSFFLIHDHMATTEIAITWPVSDDKLQ